MIKCDPIAVGKSLLFIAVCSASIACVACNKETRQLGEASTQRVGFENSRSLKDSLVEVGFSLNREGGRKILVVTESLQLPEEDYATWELRGIDRMSEGGVINAQTIRSSHLCPLLRVQGFSIADVNHLDVLKLGEFCYQSRWLLESKVGNRSSVLSPIYSVTVKENSIEVMSCGQKTHPDEKRGRVQLNETE